MSEHTSPMCYPLLDMEQVGTTLKNLRKEREITVEELRGYLGFTSGRAIYQWEKGRTLPTLDNLYAVSRYFHVPIERFLESEQERKTREEKEAVQEESEWIALPEFDSALPELIVRRGDFCASQRAVDEVKLRLREVLSQGSSKLFSDFCELLSGTERGTLLEAIKRLPILMELAIRAFAADHEGELPDGSYYDVQRLDDYLLLNTYRWLCAGKDDACVFCNTENCFPI